MQQSLQTLCMRLGDSALIAGHRLSEKCGHGPYLEQDIASTNIALDLIGQATMWLDYCAELQGNTTADTLAYFRDEYEYKNINLVELPNGDFAQMLCKQYLYDVFHNLILQKLCSSSNEKVNAIAQKGIKETTYHLRHSAEWMRRLALGTPESKQRLQQALDNVWRCTDDMFETNNELEMLIGSGILDDMQLVKSTWNTQVNELLFTTLQMQKPIVGVAVRGSVQGAHTENLGYILAEMQYLQRTYPNCAW